MKASPALESADIMRVPSCAVLSRYTKLQNSEARGVRRRSFYFENHKSWGSTSNCGRRSGSLQEPQKKTKTQGCIRQHLVHTTDNSVTDGESHEPDSYVSVPLCVCYRSIDVSINHYKRPDNPLHKCVGSYKETGRQANKQFDSMIRRCAVRLGIASPH
jgi:hypothetical protein